MDRAYVVTNPEEDRQRHDDLGRAVTRAAGRDMRSRLRRMLGDAGFVIARA